MKTLSIAISTLALLASNLVSQTVSDPALIHIAL